MVLEDTVLCVSSSGGVVLHCESWLCCSVSHCCVVKVFEAVVLRQSVEK